MAEAIKSGVSLRLTLEQGTQTISKLNLEASIEETNKLANAVAPALASPIKKITRVTDDLLIG